MKLKKNRMSKAEYVRSQGMRCPVCWEKNVRANDDHDDVGVDTLLVPCTCLSCKATWVDVYTLMGYDNLEEVTDG